MMASVAVGGAHTDAPVLSRATGRQSRVGRDRNATVDWVPLGSSLDESVFLARHRVVRFVTLAMLTAVLVWGALSGNSPSHVLVDASAIAAMSVLSWVLRDRLIASVAASLGLMFAAATLVHYAHGLTEAHFLFFILLPVVALYQDWRVFAVALGFVLVSHAVIGVLSPEDMFNHPAALQRPVLWALIHALFVAGLVVVLIIHWRFAELDQAGTRAALNDLHVAQAQLVQAQKLESIGQLAAGIAHEINTPVQYLSDNTAFLRDSFGDLVDVVTFFAERADSLGEEASKLLTERDLEFLCTEIPRALEQCEEGLRRVSEIVRAMKDFSHPGTELADMNVNRAIESTVTVSRNEWKYVAELELDLDPELPTVRFHEGQFKQVVLNLIVNAAHAIAERGGERGRIGVSTTRGVDCVVVAVTDDGCGMDDAVRARIFEPFFTTKEVGRGTGQGLSMAHQMVKAHGGTIEVTSTKGVGSTFTLTLPLVPPGSQAPS